MPKHLLVDGFNIIRRDSRLSDVERKSFYGAQDTLVERLVQYQRGTGHRITVVFDGRGGPNLFRSHALKGEVEVIYSAHGETADDVIKDLAAEAETKDGLLVATADRDLAHACKTLGVGIIAPEELLQRARPRALPPPSHEYWQGKREESGWSGHTKKKGNPKRQPKSKRRPSGLW